MKESLHKALNADRFKTSMDVLENFDNDHTQVSFSGKPSWLYNSNNVNDNEDNVTDGSDLFTSPMHRDSDNQSQRSTMEIELQLRPGKTMANNKTNKVVNKTNSCHKSESDNSSTVELHRDSSNLARLKEYRRSKSGSTKMERRFWGTELHRNITSIPAVNLVSIQKASLCCLSCGCVLFFAVDLCFLCKRSGKLYKGTITPQDDVDSTRLAFNIKHYNAASAFYLGEMYLHSSNPLTQYTQYVLMLPFPKLRSFFLNIIITLQVRVAYLLDSIISDIDKGILHTVTEKTNSDFENNMSRDEDIGDVAINEIDNEQSSKDKLDMIIASFQEDDDDVSVHTIGTQNTMATRDTIATQKVGTYLEAVVYASDPVLVTKAGSTAASETELKSEVDVENQQRCTDDIDENTKAFAEIEHHNRASVGIISSRYLEP